MSAKKMADIPAFSIARLARFSWSYSIDDEHDLHSYELYLVPTAISGFKVYNGRVVEIHTADGISHRLDTTVQTVQDEINRALEQTIQDTKDIKAALIQEVEQRLEQEGFGVDPRTDFIPKKGDLN